MRFLEPFPCDLCDAVPTNTAPFFVDFKQVGVSTVERESWVSTARGYACEGCSTPLRAFQRDRVVAMVALGWLVSGFFLVPLFTAVMPLPVALLLMVTPFAVSMVRVLAFHRAMAERLLPEPVRRAVVNSLPKAAGLITWSEVRVYPGHPPRASGLLSELKTPTRRW